MTERTDPTIEDRAAVHRALGDPTRLRIVDALQLSDRSPKELGELVDTGTNLLAFHLNALEEVGLVERTASQGDARRRYVTLRRDRLAALGTPEPFDVAADRVLFLCTANSARSQLAAQLWHARTGHPALSAGTEPARRVHPGAVTVARRRGLDLADAVPVSYRDLDVDPDLVVTVCDRAHEADVLPGIPVLHWSVPDPVGAGRGAFVRVVDDLADRVDRLARAIPATAGTTTAREPRIP